VNDVIVFFLDLELLVSKLVAARISARPNSGKAEANQSPTNDYSIPIYVGLLPCFRLEDDSAYLNTCTITTA